MIILGREFAVTGLRNVAAGRGVLIPASPLGKGKMVAQVVAIFLLLFAPRVSRRCRVAGDRRASGSSWCWRWCPAIDYFRRFWKETVAGRPAGRRCEGGVGMQRGPAEAGPFGRTPSMRWALLHLDAVAVHDVVRAVDDAGGRRRSRGPSTTAISPSTLREVGTDGYMIL